MITSKDSCLKLFQLFLGIYTPARKIEDKLDAKNLQSYPVSVRCSPPHTAKKVPINYWAYIVFTDADVENNAFFNSMLMTDRTGVSNLHPNCVLSRTPPLSLRKSALKKRSYNFCIHADPSGQGNKKGDSLHA